MAGEKNNQFLFETIKRQIDSITDTQSESEQT